MKKKIALIFGVTGQDGSYLSEFLLKKNYTVHGVKRRSSSLNTQRIDHIYQDPQKKIKNFILHYGDITDTTSVNNIIKKVKPLKKIKAQELQNEIEAQMVKPAVRIQELKNKLIIFGVILGYSF